MKKKVESGKTYIGTVEDIKDPTKDGRIKVRVIDIHSDDQELESIPWATPWKDLGGGQFSLPEIGKVVVVVFDQGDINSPEYIYTEHWNINLENKLKSLNDTDYQSMRSIIFDHKTQIYSNDGEGLKIDYKYNNINIKENGINFNLKDNNMILNLGDSAANQKMVLGTNFMSWMDQFLECFLSNTALIGNSGAPVLMSPKLADVITKFQSQKDTHLLSQHVNIVDNNQSITVKNSTREETAQSGDNWKSTVKENTLTTVSEENSKPEEGTKPEYSETFTEPPVAVSEAIVSDPIPPKDVTPLPVKSSPQSNPMIEKLIWFIKDKGYDFYEKPYELNIVAFRSAEKFETEEGGEQVRVPVTPTNKFDDDFHIFYKTEAEAWEHVMCSVTTVPGFIPNEKVLPKDVPILRLGQYKEQLKLSNFGGDEKHKCLIFEKCAIHKNSFIDAYDYDSPSEIGNFPISIHRTDKSQAEYVFNYSEGSQVFKNINQYDVFISLCQKQIDIAKKETFTYTLAFKSEFEKYPAPQEKRDELKLKLSGGAGLSTGLPGLPAGALGGVGSAVGNLPTVSAASAGAGLASAGAAGLASAGAGLASAGAAGVGAAGVGAAGVGAAGVGAAGVGAAGVGAAGAAVGNLPTVSAASAGAGLASAGAGLASAGVGNLPTVSAASAGAGLAGAGAGLAGAGAAGVGAAVGNLPTVSAASAGAGLAGAGAGLAGAGAGLAGAGAGLAGATSESKVRKKKVKEKSESEKKLKKLNDDAKKNADSQIKGLAKLIGDQMMSNRQIVKKILSKKSPNLTDRELNLIVYGADLAKEMGADYKPFKSEKKVEKDEEEEEEEGEVVTGKKPLFKKIDKNNPVFDEVKKLKTEVKDEMHLLTEKSIDLGKELVKFALLVGSTIPAAALLVAPISFNIPGAVVLTVSLLNGVTSLDTKLKEFVPILRVISKLSLVLPEEVVDEIVGKITPVVTTVTTMTEKLNSFKNMIPAGTAEKLEKIDGLKQKMSDIKKKQKELKVGSIYPTTEAELESEKDKLEKEKEDLAAEIEALLDE
jgi:hypothetical protein